MIYDDDRDHPLTERIRAGRPDARPTAGSDTNTSTPGSGQQDQPRKDGNGRNDEPPF